MTEALSAPAPETLGGGQECRWPLSAITLAGIHWPAKPESEEAVPVVMLHGWLDNAMTFARLAPELSRLAPVYALDMAGHGHSGHRPDGYAYWLMDYVADLAEWLETHMAPDGRPVDLVGHSLGGIVCALLAAAFPEKVRRLVMIDSLGALSRSVDQTIPQLRKALKKRLSGSSPAATYPDVVTASRVREGGLSPLSAEAAALLVPRNMRSTGSGQVWRTDARLRHPACLMMTEEQVRASLAAISTPALFVKASEGLLARQSLLTERAELVPGLETITVPGGHHCHLDGDPQPVIDAIKRFLSQ
ncbi:MAG: alpha/beta hydrolase [Pseudomonadota bacterium]|nr:alpha/beta hydrolase [Pseudomonadota bacterium]